ncbi:MAG TPA: hypothetical protein VFX21_09635 [Acidimicrobiia bacterium]|nr:hypothetical protein [Acidimicrobiia bacterium]
MPLPSPAEALQRPPDAEEVRVIVGGVVGAVSPDGQLTHLQRLLIEAISESMTGFLAPAAAVPRLSPQEFAHAMAHRDAGFRSRMVQFMLLGEMVLVPLPAAVAARVEEYAAELGVDNSMLRVARRYVSGSLGLALIDFQRSGYDWSPDRSAHLHTTSALEEAWELACHDPALVERWARLSDCPDGSLGLAVSRFYAARGFTFPGSPSSAPPLLAQHDWVHVLADYGSTVEAEIETFGFISRANDEPRGFALLAMVLGLFETGYIGSAAGLFAYDTGHLSNVGMPARLADAMRRGALCAAHAGNGVDFLDVDWFSYADRPIDEVRAEFGLVPKAERAIEAGSVGPWERGGISPYQYETARAAAGDAYDSYGASPV